MGSPVHHGDFAFNSIVIKLSFASWPQTSSSILQLSIFTVPPFLLRWLLDA